jgi:hypothetical protein
MRREASPVVSSLAILVTLGPVPLPRGPEPADIEVDREHGVTIEWEDGFAFRRVLSRRQ